MRKEEGKGGGGSGHLFIYLLANEKSVALYRLNEKKGSNEGVGGHA